MTKTYIDYEFFKQTQKEVGGWKPQPIHYKLRFVFRLVIAFILVYAFLCSMILIAPVHADTIPQYEPQQEKLLSYVGLQIDEDSITCLIFIDQNGKLERFAWYDELGGYGKYINSKAVYDYENDMLAVWDRNNVCIWSDWD